MRRSDIWTGITLIFLSLAFGGDVLGYWESTYFLSAWWALLVLIPCIINSYEFGIQRKNLIGIGLSIGLFLSQWFPYLKNYSGAYIFIIIGCVFIAVPPKIEGGEDV